MAVQLSNAPTQQDYMQMPQPQTFAQPSQPARNAAPEAGIREDARADDFQRVLNSLKRTESEKAAKPVKKAGAPDGEAGDAKAEPTAEPAQDLSAVVNPLMKGMEQLKQLIEAMQAELREGDVKGAMALAQDAAAKASRFNPDLVLGEDFVDGSLGKKLQELLAGAAKETKQTKKAGEVPADAEAAAEGEGETAPAAGEASLGEAIPEAGAEGADAAAELTADALAAAVGLTDEPAEGAAQAAQTKTPAGASTGEPVGDAAAETAPALPEVLPDDPFGAARDARAERASKKLAALADEMLNAMEMPSPALAEQLKALRDRAEGGLSPEGADRAAAELEEIMAKILGDAEGSANPFEGYDHNKEENAGAKSFFQYNKDDRTAATQARQRTHEASDAWDPGRDRSARGGEGAGDFGSALSASLKNAAAETFEARTAETPFGQPGATYTLNPDDAFGDGVTKMLEFLRDEGVSEARIVVEPPALGRIDVSVQARAGGVEAIFKVDNEQLKQVLQQQLDSLKSSLEAQGIHVSGLAVDIKNRDDQRRQDAQEAGKAGKRVRRLGGAGGVSGEGGEDDGEGSRLVRLDLEKGLLHWIA